MTGPEQVDPWAVIEWLEPGPRAARPDVSAFAGVGYLSADEEKVYRWDGLAWIEILEEEWEITDDMRAKYRRSRDRAVTEAEVDHHLRAMHREGLL